MKIIIMTPVDPEKVLLALARAMAEGTGEVRDDGAKV